MTYSVNNKSSLEKENSLLNDEQLLIDRQIVNIDNQNDWAIIVDHEIDNDIKIIPFTNKFVSKCGERNKIVDQCNDVPIILENINALSDIDVIIYE